jgi:isoleucyl-tRNA synthetase
VSNPDERLVVSKYADILADELNVKHVRVLDAAGEAVSFALNPLPKQLGQKYGKLFPAIRAAVQTVPVDESARLLLAGSVLVVEVDGQRIELLPEEVEVRAMAKAGYAVASEGAYLAALVTDLTPELIREGLAREFVRRVQDLRKQMDFDISDRIQIRFAASTGLMAAVESFREYIMGETLAVRLSSVEGQPDWFQDTFDGETVAIQLEKASPQGK